MCAVAQELDHLVSAWSITATARCPAANGSWRSVAKRVGLDGLRGEVARATAKIAGPAPPAGKAIAHGLASGSLPGTLTSARAASRCTGWHLSLLSEAIDKARPHHALTRAVTPATRLHPPGMPPSLVTSRADRAVPNGGQGCPDLDPTRTSHLSGGGGP